MRGKQKKIKSNIIPIIVKDTPEEAVRKTDNKEKDIRTIISIIENIDSIISSSSADIIIEKYTTIAELANKMTRFGSDCIRNKYAICWKDIYHIKIIVDKNPAHLLSIINEISPDISALKSKLLFILKDEAEFINLKFKQTEIDQISVLTTAAPSDLGERLVNIETTILKEYSSLIIDKIRSEVQVTPGEIDFVDRANSYYVARKLTIIGELLKELPRTGTLSSLISSAQVISDIRDSLIHNHKQLLSIDSIAANKLKTYTENLFTSLLEATASISVNKGLGQTLTTIFQLRHNADALFLELDKLEEKEKTNDVAVSNKNEQDKLDKLIAAANNKLNGKPVPKTWEELNEEYLALLTNIPKETAAVYPLALSEGQKSEIQAVDKRIKANKEAQKRNEDAAREIARTSKARDKFLDRLLQITNEYNFLQAIETSSISEERKDYIQQHAINVIGELMEKIRDEKEGVVIQDYHAIASSTLKSAQASGIHLRKNGLSHDIFSFSAQKFDKILSEDIIPAQDDINSVYHILGNKEPQLSSARVMNNIGVSYIRLGFYKQATEILLNAKKFLKDHPLEIQKEKMRSTGFINVPINIRFYDLDESLVGVDSYGYEITINLAEAFLLNGQVSEGISLLEELLSEIDFGVLELYGTNDFRDSVAITINSLAVSLNNAGNIDKAGSLYKQAYKLALKEDTLLLVGNNLIKFLERQNHHEEIIRIRSDLNQKASVYMEFTSKIDESYKFVTEENLIKAKALVAESELFLEANRGKLATIKGDRVALLAFDIIKAKLNISEKEPESLAQQLQEIETDFTKKHCALKVSLQESTEIGDTYLFLNNAYASLSSILTKKEEAGALDALRKAEKYFLLGEEKSLSTRSLEQSSRLLAIAYSDYSTNSGEQMHFDRAIALHTKYHTNSELTYHNWGATNLTSAEKDYARKNFKGAIPKYKEAITSLEKAGNSSTETLRTLGMCYEGLGDCTYNKEDLKKAAAIYTDFLIRTPNSSPDFEEVTRFKTNCERKARELEIPSITSFSSLVQSGKKPISTIKLNEVEKKVLNAFQHMKETEISLKIKGIEKSDLEDFCQQRLGRSDIDIKKLPTGGYYFKIDRNIVDTLHIILENKKTLKSIDSL